MVTKLIRKPIQIPGDVQVQLTDQSLTAKGKLGESCIKLHLSISVIIEGSIVKFSSKDSKAETNALLGTTVALFKNMVQGVSKGFSRKLTLHGVGYRAKVSNKQLNMDLGFSHPVDIEIPAGISISTPSQTEIVLQGIDKQKVFQMAAQIRDKRPPDPYKGKGVRYHDEKIVLKETKKK